MLDPNLRALKWDAGRWRRSSAEFRARSERNPGAWRKPPTVDYFDKEGYFRAGQGPIVFTIAEARARKAGDAIQYLPVLGVGGFIVRGWTHLLAGWGRLGKSGLMAATVLPWLRLG